jgi:hypothetical protein
MKAREKLYEVGYFLREMRRVQGHRNYFIYELSAFLSSLKSLAYYLGNEYGSDWYKRMVKRVQGGEFKYIGYYLKKRDANIHDDPLFVLQETSIEIDGVLPKDARLTRNTDQFGNILGLTVDSEEAGVQSAPLDFTATHVHMFPGSDASGKDILAECEVCYHELIRIVLEAEAEHAGK